MLLNGCNADSKQYETSDCDVRQLQLQPQRTQKANVREASVERRAKMTTEVRGKDDEERAQRVRKTLERMGTSR